MVQAGRKGWWLGQAGLVVLLDVVVCGCWGAGVWAALGWIA